MMYVLEIQFIGEKYGNTRYFGSEIFETMISFQ